jgi:hypothetical protein
MCGLYNWVVVLELVLAAYALLGVVSAVVCGVYVRLVVECLVHIGSMCLGALPFAD